MNSSDLVCLDPGHGGVDPGALGPGGLAEKEVVLDVARLAADELKRLGVPVLMTRATDKGLALGDRVRLANEAKARVFVSIHANSATNPARGIETWIARRTAVSFPLAECLQDWMTDQVRDIPDRGIRRADFHVLRHTTMAAALVELDFIHTPGGEAALGDADRRVTYGIAVARGIAQFLGIEEPRPAKDPVEPTVCDAIALADYVTEAAQGLIEMAKKAKR